LNFEETSMLCDSKKLYYFIVANKCVLCVNGTYYTVVHTKTGHYIIGDNFVKYELIFTIFAPLGR